MRPIALHGAHGEIYILSEVSSMTDKKKSIVYVVCAYLVFWIVVALIGVALMMMGENAQERHLFQFMIAFGSWTPTFVLLALFKKLCPNISIKEFYINAFRDRLNLKILLFATVTQLVAFFGAVGITALTGEVSFHSLLNLSLTSIAMGFFFSSIQGATGEQSGWRGFLQPHMEKSYGVVKSSVIVGLIWGFWHMPLWFTTEYTGLELIQYIVVYMIFVVSIAIVIGICYRRCRNLFVPIWIHFIFNFTFSMFTGDFLNMFTWAAALYILAAIGYIVWYKKSSRKDIPAV